jgi:RimJ/RimL family protein N-acetyltransferase
MTIQRTYRAELVKKLAIDPSIFPYVSDDFTTAEQWTPSVDELVVNLVARDTGGYFGFGIFLPRYWSCYDAHFGFLPRSYGYDALGALRRMFDWIWINTKAARIVGEICVENRRAIAFVKRAGCLEYGINVKSRLRGGILRDQVCFGISRP